MTYIVIHDDDSNITHHAQFDDVQAAASYLEDLVNRDGGSNARLFALEPVEFAVKSYVRVEIAGASPAPGTDVDSHVDEVDAVAPPTAPVAPAVPLDHTVEYVEAAMASADAFAPITPVADVGDGPTSGEPRRGLFGR